MLNASPTRRGFMHSSAAVLLSAAALPAEAAAAPDLEAYYSFLWQEMEAVEQRLGLDRLDIRALERGRSRANALLASTTLPHRHAWFQSLSTN